MEKFVAYLRLMLRFPIFGSSLAIGLVLAYPVFFGLVLLEHYWASIPFLLFGITLIVCGCRGINKSVRKPRVQKIVNSTLEEPGREEIESWLSLN